MYYINVREGAGRTETADQFDTHKEAREALIEYRMAFPYHFCWISSRCTNDWRLEQLEAAALATYGEPVA